MSGNTDILIRYNMEQELMFAEDTKQHAFPDYVDLDIRKPLLMPIVTEYVGYDDFEYPGCDKVVTLCTSNLLFDSYKNCYYMTFSYQSKKITMDKIEYSHRYDYEREYKDTFTDTTPYYDSLYLNDDLVYSYLLYIFIQQEKLNRYPEYDYKYLVSDVYNDKEFILGIVKIKDYIRCNSNDAYLSSFLLSISFQDKLRLYEKYFYNDNLNSYEYLNSDEYLNNYEYLTSDEYLNNLEPKVSCVEYILNDKEFMSSIVEIPNHLFSKIKEGMLIYNIFSYL
jgi:hypothetical protein